MGPMPTARPIRAQSSQPETVPHVEATVVLGRLLGHNLCYGASNLVCIVPRALEKSPCNDASHIPFLDFSP